MGSSEEDDKKDKSDSEKKSEPMDLLTLSGKRILKKIPVKPFAEAKEMKLYFVSVTRRIRGRGRGGCG